MTNNKGQALTEYLILVALIGIAAISIVSIVGKNLQQQYANISNGLRDGRAPVQTDAPRREAYSGKTLSNFSEHAQ